MFYQDRRDAGRRLAAVLQEYRSHPEAIIIALPRGGVVVGYEVATALKIPLDIVCPRKIGAPFNPELAVGAVTETGEKIFTQEIMEQLSMQESDLKAIVEREIKEAKARLNRFRKGMPLRNLKNKIVILVDDGLATGATMRAAIKTVRKEGAQKVIVAVPVAPADTLEKMEREVDQVVCLSVPESFYAVGQFYNLFDQTTDEEVIDLLNKQQVRR